MAMVIATVTRAFIQADLIRNGRFDNQSARALSRLGYMDYAVIDTVFELDRPD